MSHTSDYFRARWRAQGIPERDGFDHPRLVARGRQLHWLLDAPLRDLPWPRNLFCNDVAIEKLMADGDFPTLEVGKTPDPLKCENPICTTRHNHAVSRVRGSRQPPRPLVLHNEVPEHPLGRGVDDVPKLRLGRLSCRL